VKAKGYGFAAVIFFLFLMAGTALALKKVYNFQGGVQTRADKGITQEELAPTPSKGGFFSWTYTFMIYLDDGSSGMIQFTYWKMYIKTQRGLYFSFSDKGEKLHLRKGVFKGKQTEYTNDPPRLSMGPNFWEGFYPEFLVHLDFPAEEGAPQLKADIRFHCRTPGWRPGEGPVHYGDPDGDWYDLIVMIPWAEVEGTLTLDGKTRKLRGFGYSDHNTQDIFPTSQTQELMALRSFSEGHSVNFLDYIAPDEYGGERTTWILIMKGDRILFATDKWERTMSGFEVWEKRGYKYPTLVKVTVDQPGCRLTGEIRSKKFVEALDAIEEIPSFIRPLARRFVTAPVFIRQSVEVDWHLEMPGDGIDDRFTARGIFETTIVR
jgi:hypothetical protein